jgi:hypothetical protein
MYHPTHTITATLSIEDIPQQGKVKPLRICSRQQNTQMLILRVGSMHNHSILHSSIQAKQYDYAKHAVSSKAKETGITKTMQYSL